MQEEDARGATEGRLALAGLEQAAAAAGWDWLDDAVCGALGYEGGVSPDERLEAFRRARARGGRPTVTLDPGLHGEDLDWQRDRAVELLAADGMDSAGLRRVALDAGAAGLLSRLADKVGAHMRMCDHEYTWRRVHDLAHVVLDRMSRTGVGGRVPDVSGWDPDDLAFELEDYYSIDTEWCDEGSLGRTRVEVSLLLARKPGGYSPPPREGSTYLDSLVAVGLEAAEDPATIWRGWCDGGIGSLCRSEQISLSQVLRLKEDAAWWRQLDWDPSLRFGPSLCEAAGEALSSYPGDFAETGPFASSLRETIAEAGPLADGCPFVAVLTEMALSDYLGILADSWGASERMGIEIRARDKPLVCLYDPFTGAGGAGFVTLEHDLFLNGSDTVPMLDWRERKFGSLWTIQECFQMSHRAWETPVRVWRALDYGEAGAYQAEKRAEGQAPALSESCEQARRAAAARPAGPRSASKGA